MAAAGCTSGQADDVVTAPAPAPEVTVAEVLVRELRNWVDYTGRIEAAERVDVRPRVSGFVESVDFIEGSLVTQGQPLLQIDPRPLRAEAERLAAERDRVAAQLNLARTSHQRGERLFAEDAIAHEELETLAADVAVTAAHLASVEAALRSAELDLSFTQVVAPISGRVSRALITAGNLVDSATVLTTIVSTTPAHVYFDVDEHTYLSHLRHSAERGAPVHIGLVDERGYPHQARLDFIDNRVDATNGTMRARAVLDDSEGRFTPGLFARIRVAGANPQRTALVEDRAIGTDLNRRFVLVMDQDNVAQYRAVEPGPLLDDLRIITTGLQAGDVVIVNGLQRVAPGMPVTPQRVVMGGVAPDADQLAAAAGPVRD